MAQQHDKEKVQLSCLVVCDCVVAGFQRFPLSILISCSLQSTLAFGSSQIIIKKKPTNVFALENNSLSLKNPHSLGKQLSECLEVEIVWRNGCFSQVKVYISNLLHSGLAAHEPRQIQIYMEEKKSSPSIVTLLFLYIYTYMCVCMYMCLCSCTCDIHVYI